MKHYSIWFLAWVLDNAVAVGLGMYITYRFSDKVHGAIEAVEGWVKSTYGHLKG